MDSAKLSPSLSWDDSRLLIESVVDYAIYMLDPEGRVASWNIGAEKIKGYRANEIVGAYFSRFFRPEDIAGGRPERELDIARNDGRFEEEAWRVRQDGSQFWASVTLTAVRDANGKLLGFAKVTRDLTAKRLAEQALRLSEERFHRLVDAVLDYAIFMLDPSGVVTTWNPGARRVKGYEPDEIIGKHFSVFYTAEDRADGKPEMILESVRKTGRFESEGWRVRKDGTLFWANVIVTALRGEDCTLLGFAKVTRDLSARRDAEETGRRLVAEQAARKAAQAGEERLRESEARYRSLSQRLEIIVSSMADGLTVADRSGRIVFANPAAAGIFGFASSEALILASEEIQERFDVLDEDGRSLRAEDLPSYRVLAGERSSSANVRLRQRASGRERSFALKTTAVLGSDNAPELAISIWHDVSERPATANPARAPGDSA